MFKTGKYQVDDSLIRECFDRAGVIWNDLTIYRKIKSMQIGKASSEELVMEFWRYTYTFIEFGEAAGKTLESKL